MRAESAYRLPVTSAKWYRKGACIWKQVPEFCAEKGELLAVVQFVKHFRMYLWGRSFLLQTDHASLKWLINFKDPEGMLA